MKKYTSPFTYCSICQRPQSAHCNPIIARLCTIRLELINLALEQRHLTQQLNDVESTSKFTENVGF